MQSGFDKICNSHNHESMIHPFKGFAFSCLALSLAACGVQEQAETISDDPIAAAAVQSAAPLSIKPTPDTGFQSACTDKITAKMIDPDAANIAYAPLQSDEGYDAAVTLTKQDGSTVSLDLKCRRDAEGTITAQLIAD